MPLLENYYGEALSPEQYRQAQMEEEERQLGIDTPLSASDYMGLMTASRNAAEREVPRRELYRDYEVDRRTRENMTEGMKRFDDARKMAKDELNKRRNPPPQSSVSFFDTPESTAAIRNASEIEAIQNAPGGAITAIGQGGERTKVGLFNRPQQPQNDPTVWRNRTYGYSIEGGQRTGIGEDEGLLKVKRHLSPDGTDYEMLDLTPEQARKLRVPTGMVTRKGERIEEEPFSKGKFFPKLADPVGASDYEGMAKNAMTRLKKQYKTDSQLGEEGTTSNDKIDFSKVKQEYILRTGKDKPTQADLIDFLKERLDEEIGAEEAKVAYGRARLMGDRQTERAAQERMFQSAVPNTEELANSRKAIDYAVKVINEKGVSPYTGYALLKDAIKGFEPKFRPTVLNEALAKIDEKIRDKVAGTMSFEFNIQEAAKAAGVPQDQLVMPSYLMGEDLEKAKPSDDLNAKAAQYGPF